MLVHGRQIVAWFFSGVVWVILLSAVHASNASAQGMNSTGNGGSHTVQGSIFSPSGRRVGATGVKVRLESVGAGTLTTFADANGNFGFKNLTAGTYYVIIEASDTYEQTRESVYIDDPGGSSMGGSSSMSRGVPRTITVYVHLQPKRSEEENAQLSVINARMAAIPKAALEEAKKASVAIEKNDTKLAIEKLNEAVKLYPQFAEAYSELGSLYLRVGEPQKAEEVLRKTLQINEDNPTAQLNLGIALLNQRKMYEAEKQLEIAVLADENAATPHMYLGIALLGLDYPEYAEKEFLKAISLRDDEKVAQAHRYLGGIYWKKGDYKQAVIELEKYLKLVPKAADAEKVRSTIEQLKEKAK